VGKKSNIPTTKYLWYFCLMETFMRNPVPHQVSLGDRGRFVIPAEVRQRHGWEKGTPLASIDTEDGFFVMSADQALELVRASFNDRDPVAELLAERRKEVERERDDRP
jgi:bifunctional DNA-binding transcriptional regulator/antitoxin component of YhaV-PrlF toxin-antitoxin module